MNDLKPPPLPPFNNPIPEQAFLAKNYDENSKKPDRDPRGAFRNPADLAGAAAGIVGPLGSSTFNLPTVERALTDMEVGMGGGAPNVNGGDAAAPRRASGRSAGGSNGRPGLTSLGTSGAPPAGLSARSPGSPAPTAVTPSPTGVQTQHEVLQNFFQSLLKDRTGSVSGGTKGSPKTNGTASGTEEGPA